MDAYYQAPEHEELAVEPAPEYLERFAKAGRGTDIVWRLRRQLPGRRAAGQSWVGHVAGIIVNKSGFVPCTTAPQFYWSSERMVALELHMDDIHGAETPSGREKLAISREVTDVRQESCKQNTLTRHIFSCFSALITVSHVTLAQGVMRVIPSMSHAHCVVVLIPLRLSISHSSHSLSSNKGTGGMESSVVLFKPRIHLFACTHPSVSNAFDWNDWSRSDCGCLLDTSISLHSVFQTRVDCGPLLRTRMSSSSV